MSANKKKKYSLDNINAVAEHYRTNASSLCLPKLLQSLLSSEKLVLREIEANGILIKKLPELLNFFHEQGARLLMSFPDDGEFIFIWPDNSFVGITHNEKTNEIVIGGRTTDPKIEKLSSILEEEYVTKSNTKLVFAVIKTQTGFTTQLIGDGSSPLIEDNYLPNVSKDIEHVVSAFQNNITSGRICILNGEPGTGKTHLIRGILSKMDCIFLIIPSGLIAELDRPELMPLLLDVKNTYDKPIVMIIEDGDICLVPRKNDNISTIASLLNLSDGILGTILDIKMIVSTNQNIKDMDAAILRPGRLCRDIHVGALPYEQANKVYQRLMKDDNCTIDSVMNRRSDYTLAEIYDVVNNPKDHGLSSGKEKKTHTIGFSPTPQTNDPVLNKISVT